MKRSKLGFWLFLAPCLISFAIVVLIPTVIGIYYSLTDWKGSGNANFIGFENYIKLFTNDNSNFWYAFGYTALFAITAVICINVVGFALALLVTKKFRGATLLRGIFFMPNLIGGLLLGFAWQFIFKQVFNAIYTATGMEFFRNWLTDSTTGFFALLIVMVWQMGGYMMIIYIAAIQNIPDSVIEASAIDGAGGWRRLFSITIPMVVPAFTVGLFLMLSNSFKLFDQNLALTKGGPNHCNEMLALNIYNSAFVSNQTGYAQAKAVIFLISVATISIIQLIATKKAEVET